jgi:hypothetical protein
MEMKFNEALREVVKEKLTEQEKKPTNVALDAGLPRNFFTRWFGKKHQKTVDIDALDALAKQLGLNLLELIQLAEQKKTLLLPCNKN